MTEVAGEVADGMIVHAFTTERYLRDVTLPGARARPREGRPQAQPTSRSCSPASS